MRLLLFNLATDTDDPILGFTTRWIWALAERVKFIHVVTMRAGKVSLPNNVRVYSVGKEKGYSELRRAVEFYRHLFRILREDRIDACFSHMIPIFTILAAPVLKARRIRIVTWYAHPSLTWILKLAHHLSDRMVASVATAYPYRHNKLTVIGQGIDTELFSPNGEVSPEDPPIILCVGRLSPVKDHPTLLRAAWLLRQGWSKPFRVVIIGGPAVPQDESYVRSLHGQVKELGIEDVVYFEAPAPMTSLPSWYRRCAVYVNMTPTGSGDKVVWEAMACGKPCLVANEGFKESLGEYADRFLFCYSDPKDLAERLKWTLSLSHDKRSCIGTYLRRQVIAMHSLGRLAQNLVETCGIQKTPATGFKKQKDYNRLSDYYLLTRTFLYIVKRLHRETVEHFAPHLTGLLLDVGSGYAPYRPLFTNARKYIALDQAWDRNPNIVADVQALPIVTRVADSLVCAEVLEHVVDPDKVMEEIARTLKLGGTLLITAPMSWNLHYAPYDFRRYTCYGLRQLLERHGFELIETRRIGGLFSLVGSRLVDGMAMELYRRLKSLPRCLRHSLILCYSIPASLVFLALARIGDNFEKSDAIAWAVLARKTDSDKPSGASHKGL
jgi:glycosyltransferase involved in cell wall biosynthesis/SAM-dependent methyltransferase